MFSPTVWLCIRAVLCKHWYICSSILIISYTVEKMRLCKYLYTYLHVLLLVNTVLRVVHLSAAGMSKQVAVDKYLEKVGDLECGINSYRGYYEDKHVSINVGSRHIHIIDSTNTTINK